MLGLASSLVSGAVWAGDPTTADCLSASERSLVLRNDHKLREARAQLLVCAAASCPSDIRKECARRVADVNVAIPTVVFEAKDAFGRDISAVQVTMDGEPLTDRLEGTALSIEPGVHVFAFSTAGQPRVETRFVIREAEKERRELVTFGAPESGRTLAGPPPEPIPASTWPEPSVQGDRGLGAQRIVAIVAGSAGLVGLGVGTVFGLRSMSRHDDALQACPGACATQGGVDLWREAQTAGTVSTVAFAVGAAGLAAGAVLWFTAPRARGPELALGVGSLQLRGTWR